MAAKTIPISGARSSVKAESAQADSKSTDDAATKASANNVQETTSEGGSVTTGQKVSSRDAAAKSDYTPRYEKPSRRPAESRSASFSPLAWMADGVTGVIEEARHNDLGLSQDFWKHLYAVRRESLLTAQALVESLIDKVESKADQQEQREKQRLRRGSVDINF